jgi:hypothetical protein
MAATSSYDPVRVVRDALDAHGCQPRGDAHKFVAKCPAHEDRLPSLSVAEGSDRRALLYCHTGCEPGDIADALGLRLGDLFPIGHRSATRLRRRNPPPVSTPAAELLDGLAAAGYRFTGMVALEECPFCAAPNAWVRFTSGGGFEVQCADACATPDVLRAVATRAAIAEATQRDARRAA